MKDQHNALNTYFWNVGNDIADIRLLAEGALALYDLRERIAAMQQSHLSETIRQSIDRTNE